MAAAAPLAPHAARADDSHASHARHSAALRVRRADPRERRLAALVHSGGALRRALATLAGAFVGRRGWEALGFARAGDYARERLGLSARELRELAWVDARLLRFPALARALTTDALPWSKVRLLCRVVTAEDVELSIERAQALSCGALERAVRGQGAAAPPHAEDDAEREPVEVVRIPCSGVVRAKWWRACERARREAGTRLSAAACAETIAAEVLSTLPAGRDLARAEAPDPPAGPRICAEAPAREGARDGTLPNVVLPPEERLPAIEALTRGLPSLGAAQLDARLRRAMALDQARLAETAALLAEVRFECLFRNLGFRTFAAYAGERLGLREGRVRTLLRLARAMGLSPAFRRAFHAGEISLGQAVALVPLVWEDASFPCRKGWIARARRVTVRRLEDDVAYALAHGRLDPHALPLLPVAATDPAGPRICAGAPKGSQVRFAAEASVARLFRSALAGVRRRLARETSPGEALEVMLDYVLGLWTHEPGKARRAHRVFARDDWRCTAPGCTSYRNLHAHHIHFRSQGGGDELANQITLCAWHHLRGVHQGRLEVRGRAPHAVRYRTLLGEWAAGDWVVG